MAAETILTTTQAGALIGCSAPTVRRMVDRGALPTIGKLPGPNGPYLIRAADVYAYLAQQQPEGQRPA